MTMERVAITGFGVVSPIGVGQDSFWEALWRGKSGIGRITRFDVSTFEVQLAGGAAYSRFAQTILWLESHAEKISQVKTDCGRTEIEHNRTLHLLKARNGRGQGVKLAFNFQGESLTLREEGIIVKKCKGESE